MAGLGMAYLICRFIVRSKLGLLLPAIRDGLSALGIDVDTETNDRQRKDQNDNCSEECHWLERPEVFDVGLEREFEAEPFVVVRNSLRREQERRHEPREG